MEYRNTFVCSQETMEETGSESASGDQERGRKRRSRYNQKRRTVVNPDENFYFYWLMVLTVCILYNLWTLIVRQSFPELQVNICLLISIADGTQTQCRCCCRCICACAYVYVCCSVCVAATIRKHAAIFTCRNATCGQPKSPVNLNWLQGTENVTTKPTAIRSRQPTTHTHTRAHIDRIAARGQT